MKSIYAGVGSRALSEEGKALIHHVATALAKGGAVLRTAGAEGSDEEFEKACDAAQGQKQIILPWKGYNSNKSTVALCLESIQAKVAELIPQHKELERGHLRLIATGIPPVLGVELDMPADFVVCWTADGCNCAATRTKATGWTGIAIVAAERAGIPVFNLGGSTGYMQLQEYLRTRGVLLPELEQRTKCTEQKSLF